MQIAYLIDGKYFYHCFTGFFSFMFLASEIKIDGKYFFLFKNLGSFLNPTAMRHGKPFISMSLHSLTVFRRFGIIKTPGVAIVSCNDGLRPVIMKLEATDIESKAEE